MYVTEHLDRAAKPLFSFEIIPPVRGRSARDILSVVEEIIPYRPPFIDVTSHSADARYEELDDGTIRRRIRRKRPGTISLCGIIQNRYNIDTVPHLLCRGFTREETEDVAIELAFLGIHNVLAVRGDDTRYKKPLRHDSTTNVYTSQLVEQLSDLKSGKYLDEIDNPDPIDMCVGVGGYPEKHGESPNRKTDIKYLRQKVEAGAAYIVTQMFFDNSYYFRFVKDCRDAGIDVPIIPGIKIINGVRQLTSLPKNFNITMPDELVDEIQENPKHTREIGLRWGIRQTRELLNTGARCIHFYVMNDALSVIKVIEQL